MTSRRSFLGAAAAGLTAPAFIVPAPPAASRDSLPLLDDPAFRRLKRLRGVDRIVFNRLRHPEVARRLDAWYQHDLRCFGTPDGNGDDWDYLRCAVEIPAARPDPRLRIIGGATFTYEQVSYVGLDVVIIMCVPAVTLDVYVHRTAEEVLLAPSSTTKGPWIEWIAPSPRWLDRQDHVPF